MTSSDSGHARRPSPGKRLPVAIFLVAAAVYAATASYSVISLDVYSAYYASWRIADTGSPWIDGIPFLADNPLRFVWVLEAANGHTVIGRSPGVIIASLPAYLVGGSDDFSMAPGALTAAILTACSLVLLFLTLRTRMSGLAASLVVWAFGFTTPVWSVAANGVWPHTITILGITGMGWSAVHKRWWLAGAFGGVVLWGRLHAAIIVAVLGLFLSWRRRDPAIAARMGIASLGLLALSSVWTHWMYGDWNPAASYEAGRFTGYAMDNTLSLTNQLGMWVSADRGILVWTPVILVLLPGLVRHWRELPDWARGLLWAGLVYTVVQAILTQFSGGESFYGYRGGLEFLACATPALALSAASTPRRLRVLIGPLLAAQLVAISVGAITEAFFVNGHLVWTDNAFLMALEANPAILLPLLLAAICLSIVIQPRVERVLATRVDPPHHEPRDRSQEGDHAVAGDHGRSE
jgi:hypothetical protein